MSRVVTRAEHHRRMDSVMEPHLGYCRECRQTWPCQYERGRADEREKWEAEGPWFKTVVHQCCEVAEAIRADEREAAAQRVIKQGVSIVAGRPAQEYIMLSLAIRAVRGDSDE